MYQDYTWYINDDANERLHEAEDNWILTCHKKSALSLKGIIVFRNLLQVIKF